MKWKTVYNIHMTALQKAIDAIQSGQKSAALGLLKQAIIENPADPTAWVWLARAVDDPTKKRECLQRALRIDPEHKFAQKTLDELDGRASTPAAPAPAAPLPSVQPAVGRSLRPQAPVMKIDDALLKAPPAPEGMPPAEAQPDGAALIGAEAYQAESNAVFKEPELPTASNAVFNVAAQPPAARPASTAPAFTLSSTDLENFMNAELVEAKQKPVAPVEKRPSAAPQAAKRPAAARKHARRPSQTRQILIAMFVFLVLAAILIALVLLVT